MSKTQNIEESLPDPLEHEIFLGHEEAEKEARAALVSGRLHHAWLIEGAQGVGKATLAIRMARFLLKTGGNEANAPNAQNLAIGEDDPIFTQLAVQAHPDFLYCRSQSPGTGRGRAVIPVDEIRGIGDFFSRSAAMGGFRVCIIDAADEMNINAANALLKVLEEPPTRSLLLLPAHRAGLVPATIRSRCRTLRLHSLPDEKVESLLAHYCPDLSAEERQTCSRLAAGSPGHALRFALLDKGALYRQTEKLIRAMPQVNMEALHRLSEQAGTDQTHWDMFLDALTAWLTRAAHGAGARPIKGAAAEMDCIFRLYDLLVEARRDVARFNLNRTHAALSLLLAAQAEAAGQGI